MLYVIINKEIKQSLLISSKQTKMTHENQIQVLKSCEREWAGLKFAVSTLTPHPLMTVEMEICLTFHAFNF